MGFTRFLSIAAASATLLVAGIAGCKKDDNKTATYIEDKDFGAEYARFEQLSNNAITFTDQAYHARSLALKGGDVLGSSCATVSVDTANKTVGVDFGTVNCLCKDARYRRGRIISKYTNGYNDSGSVRTIVFDNYYINDNKIEGSVIVTNLGKNKQGLLNYSVETSVTFLTPKGITAKRTSMQKRIYTAGGYSGNVYDDRYEVTGWGSLYRADGSAYTTSIKQAIEIDPNCDWPMQGVVELIPPHGIARVLNYGGPGCDNKATLTINGEVTDITLE